MQKVSIIISAYNVEDHIAECLDSILNQTYKDFEVILVDDGSTDETLRIITQYTEQDPRIKLVYQKHSGTATARNNGLDKSTGNLITFIQADDNVEPNYLTDLVQQMEQAQSNIAVTFYKVYDEQNHSFMVLIDPNPGEDKYDGCCDAVEWFEVINPQLKELSDGIWGKLFKRELFKNVRFKTSFSYCSGEMAWWQLCFLADTISFQNKINYTHRINQKSRELDAKQSAQKAHEHLLSMQEQITMMLVCGIDTDYLRNDFYNTLQSVADQAEAVGDFQTYQRATGNLQIIDRYLKGNEGN